MAADDQLGCNWTGDLLLLGVAISCWGGSITGQKGKRKTHLQNHRTHRSKLKSFVGNTAKTHLFL
jgi:hypothetical protein